MELYLGAQVRNRDGNILGVLQRIVYDSESREVLSLVVLAGGLNEREVFLPFDAVVAGDEESVEIRLPEADYAGLDIFNETRNIAPPPDAAEVTSDFVHDPLDVPDVPPIGAATGVESITFVPIVEELAYVLSGQQVMDHSTTVSATDGEIGRIRSVLTDGATGRLSGLVVHRGAIFAHNTEIPLDLVESLSQDMIVLSVDRAHVEPHGPA